MIKRIVLVLIIVFGYYSFIYNLNVYEEQVIDIPVELVVTNNQIVEIPIVEESTIESEIRQFLINDTTDQSEYTDLYTCGWFARDLARNASKQNITLGGLVVGFHPRLSGYNNHAMNFFRDEDENIVVIEPQEDELMTLEQTGYKYYRIYENGEYVPSYWMYIGRVEKIGDEL